MNEIEATIHLPKGARPLASYARYYAYVTPDEVMGEYMLPHLDDPPGQQCEEINTNFTTRDEPCSFPALEGKEVGANQRAWLSDWHNMPSGDDHKCGALTFAFHPASHTFDSLSCLGISSDLAPHPEDVRIYERPRAFATALKSHTPMPIVVLFAGPLSPSFVLYDDGTVIKASGAGYVTDKLRADARDQFLRGLDIGALRQLYGSFRIATSTDQPMEDLLLYVGAKPVFISIYGSLADPLVRTNVPPPIMAAYSKIESFELPNATRWLGHRFPHEELWSSPNSEVKQPSP